MADMDQNAINQIIMDASGEDPGKKLAKLEKEVTILKGSIKKLIVDIREQMNNADNPFINIQQLQMPATPPVIKEDPIQFEMPSLKPEPEEEEEEEEEEAPVARSKKKAKKGKKRAAEPEEAEEAEEAEEVDSADADEPGDSRANAALRKREQELLERERELDNAMSKYGAASKEGDGIPDGYSKRDMEVMNEFEEQRRMLETMRNKTRTGGPATLTGSRKIDPYTINQIMDWTRNMIRKNGSERLNDLLEMYVSTGYLSEETKLIVQRMSKLMEAEPQRPPKKLDIKECVSDLYTLYMILNPGDKELDSRMLNVLLNPEERY